MNIGIVILFYNKSTLTIRSLKSLMNVISKDKSGFFFNIFLTDNGSDKNQSDEVRKAADNFNGINHLIKISSIYPNQGFGKGMNHGLKYLFENGTDYVLTLSNDVEINDNFFEIFLKLDKPENQIICPNAFMLMDKKKPSYTHGILKIQNEDLELSHDFSLEIKNIIFPQYYPAAALLWTKKAFEITGGFNPLFYCYWEDVELSLRCSRLKVDMISNPELKIFHLGRGTTGGKKSYYEHFLKGKEIVRKMLDS
jgi:GT2 family glycosyltransferase